MLCHPFLQVRSLSSPGGRCHGCAGGRPRRIDERPNKGTGGGADVDGRPNLEAHLDGRDGNANLEAHLDGSDRNANLETHLDGSDRKSHLGANLDRLRRPDHRPDLGQRRGRPRCHQRPVLRSQRRRRRECALPALAVAFGNGTRRWGRWRSAGKRRNLWCERTALSPPLYDGPCDGRLRGTGTGGVGNRRTNLGTNQRETDALTIIREKPRLPAQCMYVGLVARFHSRDKNSVL
jgi:hypothetical protein